MNPQQISGATITRMDEKTSIKQPHTGIGPPGTEMLEDTAGYDNHRLIKRSEGETNQRIEPQYVNTTFKDINQVTPQVPQYENLTFNKAQQDLLEKLKEVSYYSWYRGTCSRPEAEILLKNEAPGTFLVRDASKGDFSHVLTVSFLRLSGEIVHIAIAIWKEQGCTYFYSQKGLLTTQEKFPSVVGFLAYCQDLGHISSPLSNSLSYQSDYECMDTDGFLKQELKRLAREPYYYGPCSTDKALYELRNQPAGVAIVYDWTDRQHQVLQLSVVITVDHVIHVPIIYLDRNFILDYLFYRHSDTATSRSIIHLLTKKLEVFVSPNGDVINIKLKPRLYERKVHFRKLPADDISCSSWK